MYNKNELMRDTLITAKEVIFHAPTKHTLDERMINSSIIIAEERFIRPEIGNKMYEEIVLSKNKMITVGNEVAEEAASGLALEVGDTVNSYLYLTTAYQNLWKKHLWKLCAECVIVAAYPEGFVQFGSEGALHNNPPAGLMVTSGFVTPLLSSMKWVVDKKIQDRIAPLIQAFHIFMCNNKSDYLLYTKGCADCEDDYQEKQTKWAGLAMNLYPDDADDEKCCGEAGWSP